MKRSTNKTASSAQILQDIRQGYAVLLVDDALLEGPQPMTPHWAMVCGDRDSLDAVTRWAGQRRDQWAGWADMAMREGPQALDRHLRKMLAAKPPARVMATVVQRRGDRIVALAEMVQAGTETQTEPLIAHEFASADAADRMMDWLAAGTGMQDKAENLARYAWSRGTDALAEAMEAVARGEVPA